LVYILPVLSIPVNTGFAVFGLSSHKSQFANRDMQDEQDNHSIDSRVIVFEAILSFFTFSKKTDNIILIKIIIKISK
jgi:hypothetical protein